MFESSSDLFDLHRHLIAGELMVRGQGVEPRLRAPKAPVLPLDDPRLIIITKVLIQIFVNLNLYLTVLKNPIKLEFIN